MADGDDGPGTGGLVLTEEQRSRRRARNLAIAVTLAVLAALFYIVTVFKMGGAVGSRTL